jgi:prophage regulatory protein
MSFENLTAEITPLDRLLSIAHVVDLTSLSKASIYRKMAEKTFPAPLKIGKSRVAWRQSTISSWMAEQTPADHSRAA